MSNVPKPIFNKGDSVRLNLARTGMQASKDIFKVQEVNREEVMGSILYTYTLEADTGKRFHRVQENRMIKVYGVQAQPKPAELTEATVETLIAERMETSDYWIDTYKDNMALYEHFGDKIYKQQANEARNIWFEKFGNEAEREEA
jgi:hypothetical protein